MNWPRPLFISLFWFPCMERVAFFLSLNTLALYSTSRFGLISYKLYIMHLLLELTGTNMCNLNKQ
jgi:hypothetical protein